MQIHEIDGFSVNSSFDKAYTETLLRSFLAMAQAFETTGFENLSETEQESVVETFFAKPLPSPSPKDEKDFRLPDPMLFELESGERIVIIATGGQWFVVLEAELLKFRPT